MRKFISVLFISILALSFSLMCSASAPAKTYASDKIFSISDGGDTREFPRYSEEAIEGCKDLGFDAVSVKVSDENGVSLKDLENIVSITNGKILLIIDCEEKDLSSVYGIVKEKSSPENVFFRSKEMKNKDLLSWAQSTDKKIQIIPSYNGNIIFSAISGYNFAEKNNAKLCEFSSKNRYGVIFSEFFTNRFDGTKAIMSFTEKDFSGQRNDSVHGWESVISLGYSAIETANAGEFANYISLLNESYLRLEKLYNEVKDTDLTLYTSNSTADFKKELKKADEILKSEQCASQLKIDECINALEISMEAFETADGGESKTITVTPMKIFWIAFAIALFLSSQIYLYKKTKKN